jgi:P27 family predicted phage terminase small subunit
MRGRKPKPIARQISEGDPRKQGKHKLQERLNAEPQATRGLPVCPKHLRGRARAAWGFWAEELADMKLDRRPDAMMLEGACVNYARAVEADILVAREGLMVEESIIDDETKEKIVLRVKYHPGISVSNAAWRQMRSFCSEFGLSPVSRTRLSSEKSPDKGQDLLALLSLPRGPKSTSVVQ